jgi:hypothetical protein
VWSGLASIVRTAAVDAAAAGPPVGLLYAGQAVTLLVAVVAGWFSLRTKRVDADETRRARFDARVDKELDDALASNAVLRDALDKEHLLRLRYEGWLIRHGVNPETGRRVADEPA